jgi:hypothetical protein
MMPQALTEIEAEGNTIDTLPQRSSDSQPTVHHPLSNIILVFVAHANLEKTYVLLQLVYKRWAQHTNASNCV